MEPSPPVNTGNDTSTTQRLAQDEQGKVIPKTTGEKGFDGVRFTLGEGFILGLTAVLAYIGKYGPDTNFNILKKMDKGIFDALMSEKLPIKNWDNGERFAGAVASTTTFMHGGNAFAFVMKWLQERKEHIVTYFNTKFGKPGEVEAGRERLAAQEKETWGDIIKGRLVSWGIVFTSFFGADMIAGKDAAGVRRFDKFENMVGKWVAGFTHEGKEIIANTSKENVMGELGHSKSFRFGKILALDVFATTAALAIWTTISKFSAISRKKKRIAGNIEESIPMVSNLPPDVTLDETSDKALAPSHATRLGPRPADYRALAEQQPQGVGIAAS